MTARITRDEAGVRKVDLKKRDPISLDIKLRRRKEEEED